MANKKELMEKRLELQEQMQSMLDKVETETRDFSEQENSQYLTLETELRAVIEQINDTSEKNLKETKGEDKMEKRELLENFAAGLVVGEVRNMDTITQANAVPSVISADVVKKMEEISSVFNEAKKVVAPGELSILIEKELTKAKVLGETEEIIGEDLSGFEKCVLKNRRVGTMLVVSKTLLMNSPSLGMEYLNAQLAARLARTLEHEIFNGDATEGHFSKGILALAPVVAKAGTGIAITDLSKLITDINPVFLPKAKLYMNRANFSMVAQLMDGTGRPYLTHDVIGQSPMYRVLGISIEITEALTDEVVVLGNIGEAVTVKMVQDITVTPLLEKYAASGQIGIIAETYCDATVVNTQAIRILKAVV
ncbi:hypothetical protein CBE01nite_41150 [Clostridium beijerinckii]|uniref:Phage major capsid protein n=1 Tax=Clostridium beijerinckii TaxID=1520 RepID=A0AB74VFD0_CLOBE|nr:phage major capsid protein [Clostridium beijerinckii]NRZ29424.1 HK97 family phage major capsid protein [Clostridium beijerinckii]NYB94806.1 HK97 family phage major capsid protein [Clostridium beijerinckii]OOM28042.1 phage capsid family protein [Clostridium beijerinckii]QUN35057.1 phage major capsid protein [Clostridium beijerinckii]SQA99954.1 phage major capsid protein, HK97 family [Clostridium beijerinckii]